MSAAATAALCAGACVYAAGVAAVLVALRHDLRDSPVLTPVVALLWPVGLAVVVLLEFMVRRWDGRRTKEISRLDGGATRKEAK